MTTLRPMIRRRPLLERLDISNSRLYELINEGKFPKPIKLTPGGSSVAWFVDEVQEYIDTRAAERDQKTAKNDDKAAAKTQDFERNHDKREAIERNTVLENS